MLSLSRLSVFCTSRSKETCIFTILIALLSTLILFAKYQHDLPLPTTHNDRVILASPNLMSTTLKFNYQDNLSNVDHQQQLLFVQILAHPFGPFTATTKTALTHILRLQTYLANGQFSVLDVASNKHLSYQDLCYKPNQDSRPSSSFNNASAYSSWTTDNGCLVLSPLAAWNHDLETLTADPNPSLTLSNWSADHEKDTLLPTHLLNDPTNIPSASGAYVTLILKSTSPSELVQAHSFANAINSVSLDNGLIIADPLLRTVPPFFLPHQSKFPALGLFSVTWCFSTLVHFVSVILQLIVQAEVVDVVVVCVAYAMMYATFGFLFFNMSKIGSRFVLATSVLAYGTCTFLVALVISTHLLGVLLTPIMLAEALPFLVITVGFERPYLLAKAILLAQPNTDSDTDDQHIHAKVDKAVTELGPNMVGELLLEVFVLAIGAASGVRGLSEFCLLATLILLCDGIAMFTVFVSVVTLHLQNKRQQLKVTTTSPSSHTAHVPSIRASTSLFSSMTCKRRLTMATSFISYIKLTLLVGVLSVHVWSILSPSVRLGTVFELFPRSQLVDVGADHVRIPMLWLQAHVSTDPFEIVTVPPVKFLLFDHSRSTESFAAPNTPGYMGWDYWSILALLVINVGLNVIMLMRQPKRMHGTESQTIPLPIDTTPSQRENNPSLNNSPNIVMSCETAPLVRKPNVSTGIRKDLSLAEHADDELIAMIAQGIVPFHSIESKLEYDYERAVQLRRKAAQRILTESGASHVPQLSSSSLPFANYQYDQVQGQCCENVIGFVPIPVGLAGPYMIDGHLLYIPMATTEGCLVASTSRGCKAITVSGGATTVLVKDGMTRGPCIEFSDIVQAAQCRNWIESESGFDEVKRVFDSTSRFARLQKVQCTMAGRLLYIRFVTTTGDAMGMNMISKGCEQAVCLIQTNFPTAQVVAISGNYCTDKKPASINWIEGRGKSVVASATIRSDVIKSVLKTSAQALVAVNIKKNLIGSAMAGSVGGFNAHASNILTAMYLATGQDPAQNVESSQCITLMELVNEPSGQFGVFISVSMPCIEVGTVGGGTALSPQAAMLDLLGVRGPNPTSPGSNAQRLACIIAASVMAGELSLMAALTAGHLVQSHLKHNRKPKA